MCDTEARAIDVRLPYNMLQLQLDWPDEHFPVARIYGIFQGRICGLIALNLKLDHDNNEYM